MRIRPLGLAVLLALPTSACAFKPKPVPPTKPPVQAPSTATKYKLQKIAAMAAAFDAIQLAAPKAAATKASQAQFHEAVSLLFAAEKARKAGDLAAAKTLSTYASEVIAKPGTSRLTTVQKDANLAIRLKEAGATLPDAAALTQGVDTWLKQGWEPDFF